MALCEQTIPGFREGIIKGEINRSLHRCTRISATRGRPRGNDPGLAPPWVACHSGVRGNDQVRSETYVYLIAGAGGGHGHVEEAEPERDVHDQHPHLARVRGWR